MDKSIHESSKNLLLDPSTHIMMDSYYYYCTTYLPMKIIIILKKMKCIGRHPSTDYTGQTDKVSIDRY
jgi:hypothetical protein